MRDGNLRALTAGLHTLRLEQMDGLFMGMLGHLAPIVPENIWNEALTRTLEDIKARGEADDIPMAEPSEVVG